MEKKAEGLYWTPRGGNGTNLMWGSCHEYTSVVEKNGETKQDTVLIDLGQFESPHKIGTGDLVGKYNKIVPDVTDLVDTPDCPTDTVKASALLLTHGHSDHIEGIYEYAMMGAKLPPVYASEYTFKLLQAGFVARGLDWKDYIEPHVVKEKDVLHFGEMTVEVAAAPHSVPGSLSFKVSNENASVFHSGDMRLEEKSYIRQGADLAHFAQMGKDGVDFAVMDACAAGTDGYTRTETQIHDTFTTVFAENESRQAVVVVPPGHVERIATVLQAAKDAGRQVVIDGGPIMYAHLMGLEDGELLEKFPNVVPAEKLKDTKNSVILTCGIYASYDNESSPLVRALKQGEKFSCMDDDALVVIAHEEESLKDMFVKSGLYPRAKVVSGKDIKGLFGGGHAQKEDLKVLVNLLNPRCVAPMHAPTKIAEEFNFLMTREGRDTLTFSESKDGKAAGSVHNGDTIRIVRGEKPQVVETRDMQAFCFRHSVVTERLDFPPYEKTTFEQSKITDRHSYRELGINTEARDAGFVKRNEKREKLEAKKQAYRAAVKKSRRLSNIVRGKLVQNDR